MTAVEQTGRAARVLHVAAVQYTVEHLLLPQLCALREAGFDVRVACALEDRPSRDLAPFRPVHVPFPRSAKPGAVVRACLGLVGIINRYKPDVVHLHSPAVALPVRLIPRALLPETVRIVYTVHGFAHQWDRRRLRDRPIAWLEKRLSGRTDLMLFQSAEDLAGARVHRYRSELVYLGNGISDPWFEVVRPELRGGGALRVLFVGRLVREKGLLELLEAVEQVPRVHLSVVGEELASERDGIGAVLRARARSGPLAARLQLLGKLDQAGLRQVVGRCDVLVLPSHREGLPRSVIEALAAGRPVIATDIRGCRELVQHGRNGFLVPPGDVRALAEALVRAASMRESDFLRMSGAARESVSGLRESTIFERLLSAYASLGLEATVRQARVVT